MIKTSCGVIVTDGKKLLIGHSTNNKHFDIPKGIKEEGETLIVTSLRELEEETSIIINRHNLQYLGVDWEYTRNKKLCLFLYTVDVLPDINSIKCTSMFCDKTSKKMLPELDFFLYVSFDKLSNYVTKNLYYSISKLCKGQL